jgi:hypothetical protein
MANANGGSEWLMDVGKMLGDMRAPTVDVETVVANRTQVFAPRTQHDVLAGRS